MGRRAIPRDESPVRRALLRAAARVFSRRTLANTSVEDLLAAADVSRRSFYRVFPNLEALLAELYDAGSGALRDAIVVAMAEGKTAAEKRAGLIDAYLSFDEKSAPLMRVLEAEAFRPDSGLAAKRIALFDALGVEIARAFAPNADPLLIQGVLLGLEGILLRATAAGPLGARARRRVRAVMIQLTASLGGTRRR